MHKYTPFHTSSCPFNTKTCSFIHQHALLHQHLLRLVILNLIFTSLNLFHVTSPGHVAALKYVQKDGTTNGDKEGTPKGKGLGQYSVFNLGTGVGYSVLDMVNAMKTAR